jgi:hemerythrin-like domain-containing protein
MTKKAKRKNVVQSSIKGKDLIDLLVQDHKPLRKLLKVMKDSDKNISTRRKAFEEFGPLLVRHAQPEEQVLYVVMKKMEGMREDGFEGDVEHGLADQMLEEAKRTKDGDLWGARVKVLAELIEHHLDEEEEEVFPEFKKKSEKEQRIEMGQEYLECKENTLADGRERDPGKKVEPVLSANY